MIERIKQHQRALLVILIAVCMVAALTGGVQYF